MSRCYRADEERAWARKTQEQLGKRAESLAAAEARSEAASRDLERQTTQLQVNIHQRAVCEI